MFNLDYQSRVPIYEQIVNTVERYVALGILKPKEQISSIRDLANTLGINPNTVRKAYEILEQKGIIMTISTKGTFISEKTKVVIKNKIEKSIKEIRDKIEEITKLGLTKEEVLKRLK